MYEASGMHSTACLHEAGRHDSPLLANLFLPPCRAGVGLLPGPCSRWCERRGMVNRTVAHYY